MCIIIDTNTFASVFDPSSARHSEFQPVLKWIVFGNGRIVYGGTKYKDELKGAKKYLRLFGELAKKRKVVEVNETRVDEQEIEVVKIANNPKFNDPQIVAIVIVSGCKLICSGDKKAYAFFKQRKLYPKNAQRPKIYSKLDNQDLLSDQNIAEICRPASRLPKSLGEILMSSTERIIND